MQKMKSAPCMCFWPPQHHYLPPLPGLRLVFGQAEVVPLVRGGSS